MSPSCEGEQTQGPPFCGGLFLSPNDSIYVFEKRSRFSFLKRGATLDLMSVIQAWFPTYIYFKKLQTKGLTAFNRELLTECYQIRDYDFAGQKWSKKNYPGGYTSYQSIPNIYQLSSTMVELREKIDRHVRAYAKHLQFDLKERTLSMTDCWINIMPTQAVHSLHLHPLSTISGTYYVRTPKNCSSIKFEDPRLSKFMASPLRCAEVRPENRLFVHYKAEVGHVVLFESWLRHEVGANPAASDRVSISFNYNWF